MVVGLRREPVGRARASLAGGGGRSERWAAPQVFYCSLALWHWHLAALCRWTWI